MSLPDRWNPRVRLRDWLSKLTPSELCARRGVAELLDAMEDSIAASALARDSALSSAVASIDCGGAVQHDSGQSQESAGEAFSVLADQFSVTSADLQLGIAAEVADRIAEIRSP